MMGLALGATLGLPPLNSAIASTWNLDEAEVENCRKWRKVWDFDPSAMPRTKLGK